MSQQILPIVLCTHLDDLLGVVAGFAECYERFLGRMFLLFEKCCMLREYVRFYLHNHCLKPVFTFLLSLSSSKMSEAAW